MQCVGRGSSFTLPPLPPGTGERLVWTRSTMPDTGAEGQRGGEVIYVRLAPPGPKGERRGWHPPRLLWRLTSQKRCWKNYISSWPFGPLLYHISQTLAPLDNIQVKGGHCSSGKIVLWNLLFPPKTQEVSAANSPENRYGRSFGFSLSHKISKKHKISESEWYLNTTKQNTP